MAEIQTQNEYELVVILRPDIDDAETNSLIERIESIIAENGGQLLDRDDWGKRKLAYPISKHLKGHYVLFTFVAPPDLIVELERRIRIMDAVIRFLTVKQLDAVDIAVRQQQAAEIRRRREEARAARAAEEDDDDDRDDRDEDEDEDGDAAEANA